MAWLVVHIDDRNGFDWNGKRFLTIGDYVFGWDEEWGCEMWWCSSCPLFLTISDKFSDGRIDILIF